MSNSDIIALTLSKLRSCPEMPDHIMAGITDWSSGNYNNVNDIPGFFGFFFNIAKSITRIFLLDLINHVETKQRIEAEKKYEEIRENHKPSELNKPGIICPGGWIEKADIIMKDYGVLVERSFVYNKAECHKQIIKGVCSLFIKHGFVIVTRLKSNDKTLKKIERLIIKFFIKRYGIKEFQKFNENREYCEQLALSFMPPLSLLITEKNKSN